MPITDKKIEGYIRSLMNDEDSDITERSVGFLYARLLANPARYGIDRALPRGISPHTKIPTYEEFVQVCVERFGAYEDSDGLDGGLFVPIRRSRA